MINLISTAEAAIIILAFRRVLLLSRPKINFILSAVCFLLLSFNLYKYLSSSLTLGYLRLPVEFSAVSYFLVPVIVLFKIPALKSWAAYSALLAGCGYFISALIFGDLIYAEYETQSIATALLCHGALLFCGLLLISQERFSARSNWVLTAGLVFIGANALLLKSRFGAGNGIFIYELLFALRPIKLFGSGILPIYYVILFTLVLVSLNTFYKVNQKLAKK